MVTIGIKGRKGEFPGIKNSLLSLTRDNEGMSLRFGWFYKTSSFTFTIFGKASVDIG